LLDWKKRVLEEGKRRKTQAHSDKGPAARARAGKKKTSKDCSRSNERNSTFLSEKEEVAEVAFPTTEQGLGRKKRT